MKRKIIVLTFMLSFLGFISKEMQAQTDAYFSNSKEFRSSDAVGAGLGFDGFSGQPGYGLNFGSFDDNLNGLGFNDFGNDGGLGFDGFGFGGEDGDVPLGSGTLFLCSLAAAYMVRKGVRSKESFGR